MTCPTARSTACASDSEGASNEGEYTTSTYSPKGGTTTYKNHKNGMSEPQTHFGGLSDSVHIVHTQAAIAPAYNSCKPLDHPFLLDIGSGYDLVTRDIANTNPNAIVPIDDAICLYTASLCMDTFEKFSFHVPQLEENTSALILQLFCSSGRSGQFLRISTGKRVDTCMLAL